MLHFAGGNRYSYQFITPYLKDFEVIPLELPGRGKRMGEMLLTNYQNAVNDYVEQIKSLLGTSSKYILYGHSMGATLGVLITSELENAGLPPSALIVSGNPGPGAKTSKIERYKMPHNQFVDELKKLGGVPDEFFEHQELFEFFEPVMRADFEILEKEEIILTKPVNIPIYAMMGSQEKEVDLLDNWTSLSKAKVSQKIYEGDHFFIKNYAQEIATEFANIAMSI